MYEYEVNGETTKTWNKNVLLVSGLPQARGQLNRQGFLHQGACWDVWMRRQQRLLRWVCFHHKWMFPISDDNDKCELTNIPGWFASRLGRVETQVIWQCFSSFLARCFTGGQPCFGDCILGNGRHKTSLFIRMMPNAGRRGGTSVATTSPPSTGKLSTQLEGDPSWCCVMVVPRVTTVEMVIILQ